MSDLKELFSDSSLDVIWSLPDGPQIIKSLIFSLATSGKLYPQTSRERQPAELIYLLDDPKRRHEHVAGWLKIPLSMCGEIYNGNSTSPGDKAALEKNSQGLNYIATKDVSYGFEPIKYDTGLRVGSNERNFKVAPKNSVLICLEGGSAGKKMGIVEQDICFGNKLFAITCREWLRPRFLLMYFLSSKFQSDFRYQMSGIIGGISKKKFSELTIPIPPLAEQDRIIQKVDALAGICDQLGEAKTYQGQVEASARKSTIDSISIAQSTEDFNVAWERILENWDLVSGTTESIQALRGLILDFAVTGRLLSSELQPTEPVTRDSHLDESLWSHFAPKGWNLMSLEDACLKISDGTHKTPSYQESGVPFLSIKDISGGAIDFSKTRFISNSQHEELCKRIRPTRGDVLFCRIGTLGKAITIETDREFSIFVSLGLLRPRPNLSPKFLEIALNSPISSKQLESIKAGGSHAQKLNLNSMRQFVIWFPDLKSQEEIVQKVSGLMDLCHKLEQKILDKELKAEQFARLVLSA
jgi:type I restriction enzyme S subunit